jgi:hypothetical protein
MAVFVHRNFGAMQAMMRYAKERAEVTPGYDYRYFTNASNALFLKARRPLHRVIPTPGHLRLDPLRGPCERGGRRRRRTGCGRRKAATSSGWRAGGPGRGPCGHASGLTPRCIAWRIAMADSRRQCGITAPPSPRLAMAAAEVDGFRYAKVSLLILVV